MIGIHIRNQGWQVIGNQANTGDAIAQRILCACTYVNFCPQVLVGLGQSCGTLLDTHFHFIISTAQGFFAVTQALRHTIKGGSHLAHFIHLGDLQRIPQIALPNPFGASDAQISTFLDSVYNNLFNRSSDSGGLAYWTGQVRQTLASGKFVGSVLVDIMSGAQDTAAGKDMTTLMGKVAVSIEYVQEQPACASAQQIVGGRYYTLPQRVQAGCR